MKAIDLGDLTMHVVDQGQGTPLLLVHGFPLDHSMWRHQIAHFSSGCRVIAPDLRGFGKTGSSDGVASMELHASDLNRLLDELDVPEPVIFCGLSMGGYIGWQFLRNFPLRVAALIAADTKSAADTQEAAQNRHQMAERVLADGPVVAVDAMLPKLMAPSTYERLPDLVEDIRQIILRTDPIGIAASQRGMAARPDATGWLKEIDVPALFIAGEHDSITPPKEMNKLAAAIPQATFKVIPDAGHLSPLENASAFNQALEEFLSG